MRRTGLVALCSPSCIVPNILAPTAKPSNKTMEEAKEKKSDSMIPMSVTIPKIFPTYAILKLSSSNIRDPVLPIWLQLLVNQPI